MLKDARIGLKVDVDTLRGTREGVPRLTALFKKLKMDATFYFSVGPDHTGRAMRRVFRKGFAQKVARTSVLKHYGMKTLLYGVLLPGPDIGRSAGGVMRSVHDAGFEVGLHTYDHVRWQDHVVNATPAWTRVEFERGLHAFETVFGFAPQSHAAAGWQINAAGLELEQEYGLKYASDTRGGAPFLPAARAGPPAPVRSCPRRCPPSMKSWGWTASMNRASQARCFAGRRLRIRPAPCTCLPCTRNSRACCCSMPLSRCSPNGLNRAF